MLILKKHSDQLTFMFANGTLMKDIWGRIRSQWLAVSKETLQPGITSLVLSNPILLLMMLQLFSLLVKPIQSIMDMYRELMILEK